MNRQRMLWPTPRSHVIGLYVALLANSIACSSHHFPGLPHTKQEQPTLANDCRSQGLALSTEGLSLINACSSSTSGLLPVVSIDGSWYQAASCTLNDEQTARCKISEFGQIEIVVDGRRVAKHHAELLPAVTIED